MGLFVPAGLIADDVSTTGAFTDLNAVVRFDSGSQVSGIGGRWSPSSSQPVTTLSDSDFDQVSVEIMLLFGFDDAILHVNAARAIQRTKSKRWPGSAGGRFGTGGRKLEQVDLRKDRFPKDMGVGTFVDWADTQIVRGRTDRGLSHRKIEWARFALRDGGARPDYGAAREGIPAITPNAGGHQIEYFSSWKRKVGYWVSADDPRQVAAWVATVQVAPGKREEVRLRRLRLRENRDNGSFQRWLRGAPSDARFYRGVKAIGEGLPELT